MKKMLLLIFCLNTVITLSAQRFTPVQAEYTYQQLNDSIFRVYIDLKIDSSWYILDTKSENVSVFVGFEVVELQNAKSIGRYQLQGEDTINGFDPMFGCITYKYYNQLTIYQDFKLTELDKKGRVKVGYEYMVSDSKKLFPPKYECAAYEFIPSVQKKNVVKTIYIGGKKGKRCGNE